MAVLDLAAGLALAAAALTLRRSAALTLLGAAAALLWFVGGLIGPLVLAHRGPLTHLLLIYPGMSGTRVGRLRVAAIAAAYAASTIYPLGRLELVGLLVWSLVLIAVVLEPHRNSFRDRSRRFASWSEVALWSVPTIGAGLRAAGVEVGTVVLAAYEVMVIGIVAGLVLDDRYSRRRADSLATLAIDLGEDGAPSLSEAVGRALRDPSVRIGLIGPAGTMVDEHGEPLALPETARTVTELRDEGGLLGTIEHDPSAPVDPVILASVKAHARIALSNAKLQAEVEDRISNVDASRRRLLNVADAERITLAQRIDADVRGPLLRASALLHALPDPGDLPGRLSDALRVVEDFGRGVRHPGVLDEQGLAAALAEIVTSIPIPVDVKISPHRLPGPVEAASYLIVAETLTNMVKHAKAARAGVSVIPDSSVVIITVRDDGIGGAELVGGSGLAGLRDRADVLGGSLVVISPAGSGTTVTARIPC